MTDAEEQKQISEWFAKHRKHEIRRVEYTDDPPSRDASIWFWCKWCNSGLLYDFRTASKLGIEWRIYMEGRGDTI